MRIIYKNINEIKEYENNPRFNENAVEFVANSIKEFGFKNPCIIDKNNVLVAGHTRLLAAKKLELQEVPCIIAEDLTDEQIRAFRLADNRTAEFSKWDHDKLLQEYSSIEDDLAKYGFTAEELESYGKEVEVEDFLTDEKKQEKEPKTIICPKCGKEIKI